jgi:hypothetical protein
LEARDEADPKTPAPPSEALANRDQRGGDQRRPALPGAAPRAAARSRTLVWQGPVATAAAGATMSGLEYMTAVVTGVVPPPPIAVTMRLRPIELEEGRVQHYNPIGVVHGGYAATLLDSDLPATTL